MRLQRYSDPQQPGKGFKIQFMNWEEYKEILMLGSGGQRWSEMCGYDCIIGGIDLDMGYL